MEFERSLTDLDIAEHDLVWQVLELLTGLGLGQFVFSLVDLVFAFRIGV